MDSSASSRLFSSFYRNQPQGPVRRAGEYLPRIPDRSRRLVRNQGHWFFRARERDLVGPYYKRDNAEKASQTYMRFCRNLSREKLQSLIQQHVENLHLLTEEEQALSLREGEMDIPVERESRIVAKDDRWYFQTREGELVGPYATRDVAEEASATFLQFVQNVDRGMIGQLIAAMKSETEHS